MLKVTLLFLATSYFAWYLERFETAMVYPFDPTHVSPEVAGERRMTEMRFTTADGEGLVVWHSKARTGHPTIIYFPGNAGGLKDRVERFGRLIDRGYGVTAMAYRGSSGSSGRPEELLLTEDAVALTLAEAGRPLVFYGESLGTALAIRLAASGLGDALVLEAPFTSIADLVESQFPDETVEHLITQRWDSLQDAPQVRQPLLVMHGSDDRLVPVHMGRMIFNLAASREKRFVEITGRGHSGLWTTDAQRALYEFLDAR